MAAHDVLRRKYFLPVRPLDHYLAALRSSGFEISSVRHRRIPARVTEWFDFLKVYHEVFSDGSAVLRRSRVPVPHRLLWRIESDSCAPRWIERLATRSSSGPRGHISQLNRRFSTKVDREVVVMRWSGTSWIAGVAWVLCTAFGAELEGQEDNGYTNLRVLPSDISRAELGQVMLDHLAGLGLPRRAGEGCLHCHSGSLEVPRSEWTMLPTRSRPRNRPA